MGSLPRSHRAAASRRGIHPLVLYGTCFGVDEEGADVSHSNFVVKGEGSMLFVLALYSPRFPVVFSVRGLSPVQHTQAS